MKRRVILAIFAVILCILPTSTLGWVMGIDLGNEWFKVGLVRPRFDVALNDQSSRKTPSVVAFNQDNILIGTDAKNLITRFPKLVYSNSQRLLGKEWNDPQIKEEIEAGYFPYQLVQAPGRKGSYGIYYDENITFSAEDIVAMMLANAKQTAAKTAQMTIKDSVITVPAYYTQAQRQGLLDAAKIAGVNVLSLMNDNTAIALNWGIERQFDENITNVIFYDMGSSHLTVSLVSYKALPDQKKNKTVGQLQIQSVAWDDSLGGREFDRRLAMHFAEHIQKQHKVDLTKDARAWAKLMKEAQKVKEILSANIETKAAVEGITSDFDFKMDITREKFEELCSDLFERALKPINQVLAEGELTIDDVSYFELVGGGVRVPKLQQLLKEHIKRDLDKHLNGDEAAVMGATFYGASQSAAFKAREFKVKDLFPYSVEAAVKSDSGELDKDTEVFRTGSRFNAKKSVTFFTDENFTLSVTYESSKKLPKGTIKTLGTYSVSGLPTNDKYNFTGKPKVHAGFRLDGNSMVIVDKIEAEVEVTEIILVPVKKDKETKTEETTESTSTTTTEEAPSTTEETEAATQEEEPAAPETASTEQEAKAVDTESPEATTESEQQEPEMVEKVNKRIHRVTLKTVPVDYTGMSESDFSNSKKILQDINRKVDLKREREREKNNLEAYIYEMREKLDTEELISVSTEEQRETLRSELNNAGDWLYEGEAETSEYKSKYDALKKVGDKILKRASELVDRPSAIDGVRSAINLTRVFMENITNAQEVTEEEKEDVLESCIELENWMNSKIAEQEKLQAHEDLAFTSDQLQRKWKAIETKIKPLIYRRAKKPPKPESTTIPERNTTQQETQSEQSTEDHDHVHDHDHDHGDDHDHDHEHAHDEL